MMARRTWITRLAALAAGLMLAVIFASAYLRLAQAGLGCADWPACYGQLGSAADRAGGIDILRLIHRVTATSALLAVLALVWLTLRAPRLPREAGHALVLLALSLGLAVLGWIARNSAVPLVVLANLIGGFCILIVAWRLWRLSAPRPSFSLPGAAALRPWLLLGLVLLLGEILVGGLISAQFAARSCLTLPACGEVWWPAGDWLGTIDLARAPETAQAAGERAGVALHMLHRVLAVAVALILGTVSFRAIALTPALAILALLFLEFLLGAASVSFGLPLLLVVAHNVVAALLLAAATLLLLALRRT